jgi:hypothetical protein
VRWALLALVLAACSATEPPTRERAAAVTATPTLTPKWNYSVTKNGSGSGSAYYIETAANKQQVIDAIQASINQRCPNDPGECRVDLFVNVCDRTSSPTVCTAEEIAARSSWVYVIDKWHQAQADQVAFLQQRNVSAEWLRAALEHHRKTQAAILAQAQAAVAEVHDARDALVQATHDRIAAMGGAVKGAEQVHLAETRMAIRELERVHAAYRQALDDVRPQYGDVVARFTAYRGDEPTVIGELEALIESASGADLDAMAALKLQLAAISDAENQAPQQLILDANRVRWELAHAQAEYERGIAPHAAMMDERAWPRLDHTTAPRGGMGGVVSYAEGRQQRVNDAVREIFDGLRRREQVLVVAAADAATRDAIRASIAANTEADFLDEITRRVTELWTSPPTTPILKLPLLGERVGVMQAFLPLEDLCAASTAATWRVPGCQKVAIELPKVRKYLSQQLPFTIRYGIPKLRAAGVPEAELAEIDADLTAGRVTAAVHRYDAALRAVEEE